MAKKETDQIAPTFEKDAILNSKKYADQKDLVNAIIPEGFQGTLAEADALINDYMKGQVK